MSDELSNDPVAISYSGGSASESMIHAVIQGKLRRPEHLAVFFSDTMDEHVWTYDAVADTEERCRKEGITFIRCGKSVGLVEHMLKAQREEHTRSDHPPYWTEAGGVLPQRCTREFKIAPMRRAQSEWLKSIGKPKKIIKWIGFGAEEVGRAVKAANMQDVQWEKLDFPLIRLGWRRSDSRALLLRATGRAPEFSMCRKCPHKTPARWAKTPATDLPEAYDLDEAIRDMSAQGVTDGDTFITNRLIPLERLIKKGDPTPMLPGFESYCDGGACFL